MTGTSRRTLLKQSAVIGLAGMLPQVAERSGAPEAIAAPSEPTGATTTYTMQGFFLVDEGAGPGPIDYRKITFTVNHHEDFGDSTVDVIVENPLRPEDAFDFRVGKWQGLSGVLAEVDDYVGEQRRRDRVEGAMTAEQVRAHQKRQLGPPA